MAYKLVKKLSTGQLADYAEEVRERMPGGVSGVEELQMVEYAIILICAAREAEWFVDEGPSDDAIREMDYLEESEPLSIDILKLYQKYALKMPDKTEKKSSSARRQNAR